MMNDEKIELLQGILSNDPDKIEVADQFIKKNIDNLPRSLKQLIKESDSNKDAGYLVNWEKENDK